MEIEINIMQEVLEFNPTPPKKVWLDRVPNFILFPVRRFFGVPGPTPLEHWHLCLVFVRQALDVLIKERQDLMKAPIPKEYLN